MTLAAIRKIAIVGGGTAGWMTAAALGTMLPDISIELIESDEIGTVGVGEATIPQIHLFNEAVGITDAQMLRETQATYKLGIEFVGWHTPDARYLHPFGAFGVPVNGVDFWHYWIRARQSGMDTALAEFNVNAVAAYAGRFAKSGKSYGQGAVPGLFDAFHFDASLYAALLRRVATARGVMRTEGKIVTGNRDGETGLLKSVTLSDGRNIHADFFIDCSGFQSLLLGQTMGVEFCDWSNWLPCDRAIAMPTARQSDPLLYTQATAQDAGWTWRIPLQHRTGNGYVYSSAHISDEQALDTLLTAVEGEPLADPRPLRFKAGHRARIWEGNVVAIGLAGGFLEPLESTSIHLIQTAISRLITLFPRHMPSPGAQATFNRQSADDYAGIRDFLIFHYHANQRDGPFWRNRRDMTLPDTMIEQRIHLFQEVGRIARAGHELFSEASWLAVMLGQGIDPVGYAPLADSVPHDDLAKIMASLRQSTAQAVATLPPQMDFIAKVI
jgi:tryptophan 7-halogenase